ncbi:MAG TPA: (2Fe-2S)-binding protein, partial [Polymorphobacter sp.]|nr:(2Fe-2S)-binding protein [Polymorphobacter sp.]
ADGGLASVTTAHGSEAYRVVFDAGQRRGGLFVPIHWSRTRASGGLTGSLAHARPDPHSGQPAFKSTPASIAPLDVDWHGFLLTRARTAPAAPWWVHITADGCERFEIAGQGGLEAAAAALCAPAPGQIVTEMRDGARGLRCALSTGGRLDAVLLLSAGPALPGRDWLAQQFAAHDMPAGLLAGAPAGPVADVGVQICACFNVGLNTLTAAIRSQRLADVGAIGAALGAGSNCGSCKPELARLLHQLRETEDA